MTSGRLGGVMISTLVQNARNVGLNPSLGTIFPIFRHIHDVDCNDHDPVQARHCVVVEPTLCVYVYGHCLYV